MDFDLGSDQIALKQKVRQFTEKEIIPRVAQFETDKLAVYKIPQMIGDAGLFEVVVPKEYGGYSEEVSCMAICLTREELAKGYYFAGATIATQGLGSVPISLFGKKVQKEMYLAGLASGKQLISFCLTEPEAGSDVSSIRTTAVREGGSYIINGQKCFASNAGLSDCCLVFAKTDLDKGAKGLSAFLVDVDAPGLTLSRKMPLLCVDVLGEYSFDNCRVPQENLLGELGEGFSVAMKTLDVIRPTVGAHAVGLAQAALDQALAYAQQRVQFRKKLAEMQAIQFNLAQMATELSAARLLVYQAAIAKDKGDPKLTIKSSMAKLYATETAQRVVDAAVQIHGGYGVLSGDFPMERFYREVRAPRIYEGTSEIQKIIIARRMLKGQSIELDRE